ncbi:hypothetical protein CEY15_07215 [Dietzia natronolimnaea]|uniref:Uncharacterized protein n=1 Tax=Dietzia natronolimnaea TaxID=161920 RepID=A0A2A2WRS0_9ACTN|nr:hypothetical protein [Dietzia natronolimnaea]PAY23674.1 hypothetical protein CEY15_07215 [Dietzia natronolimnaea]
MGTPAVDMSGLGTADRVAELRRRLATMPGGGPPAAARSGAPAFAHQDGGAVVEPVGTTGGTMLAEAMPADPMPEDGDGGASGAVSSGARVPGVVVPCSVAPLLPGGVLPAGRVTAVSGSATLRVGLLAAATAAGARCAVVGWPELGVAAVAEQGGRLDCLALVPDPGPDPAAVVSVLLDGLDLVLLGPGVRVVAPSRARVLAGRVRAAGAVLLVGADWPGAELALTGRHCRYGGLGAGAGRLASVSTMVRCTGRAAPPRTAEWVAAG